MDTPEYDPAEVGNAFVEQFSHADAIKAAPGLSSIHTDDLSMHEYAPRQFQGDKAIAAYTAHVGGLYQKRMEDLGQAEAGAKLRPEVEGNLAAHVRHHVVRTLADRMKAEGQTGRGTAEYILGKMVPFRSSTQAIANALQSNDAAKAVQQGQGDALAYQALAKHHAQAETDQEKSTAGHVLDAVLGVPAVVGEFAAGGTIVKGAAGLAGFGAKTAAKEAVPLLSRAGALQMGKAALTTAAATPLVPSSYVDRWLHNNEKEGRDPLDWKGLPNAVALAAVQNAVIGSIGQVTGRVLPGAGLPRAAGRVAIQGAAGVPSQAITDVVTSSLGLDTGYGILGDLAEGKYGEAAKKAAVTAMTFASFGIAHEISPGKKTERRALDPGIQAFAEYMKAQAKQGVPIDQAAQAAEQGHQELQGRAAAKQMYEQLRRSGMSQEAAAARVRAKFLRPQQQPAQGPEPGIDRPLPEAAEAPPARQEPPTPQPEAAEPPVEPPGAAPAASSGPDPAQGGQLPSEEAPRAVAGRPEASKPRSAAFRSADEMFQELLQGDESGRRSLIDLMRENYPDLKDWEPPPTRQGPPTPEGRQGGPPAPEPATGVPGIVSGAVEATAKPMNAQAREEFLRDVIAVMRGQESPGFHPDQARVQEEAQKRLAPAGSPTEKRKAIRQAEEDWRQVKERAVEEAKQPPATAAPGSVEPPARVGEKKNGWTVTNVLDPVAPHVEVDAARRTRRNVEGREGIVIAEHSTEGGREFDPKEWQAMKEGESSTTASETVEPQTLDEAFDKAHLSNRERYVVRQRLEGRSHASIATDSEMANEDGTALTRQRVHAIEKEAIEKIGGDVSIAKSVFEQEKIDHAIKMLESGQRVNPSEMRLDPAEVAKRIPVEESKADALDRLADQLLKESEDGTLTPERLAWFNAEGTRLNQTGGRKGKKQRGASEGAAQPIEGGRGQTEDAETQGPQVEREAVDPTAQGGRRLAGGRSLAPRGGSGPVEPARPAWLDAGRGTGERIAAPPDEPFAPIPADPGWPGAGVGAPRPERVDPLIQAGRELVQENMRLGAVAPGSGAAQALFEHFGSAVRHLRNSLAELSGRMAPRTTALDRASGEALTRYNAAPGFAREAAPVFIDKIMGPDATPSDRLRVGAVMTERRLRHIRDVYTAQGDTAAAGKVKTIIGQQNSPLATEADYQQALADPRVQGVMQRFKQHFVPKMEDNYRRAQGLEDSDPINSPTQIPGEPVNLKALTDPSQVTDSTVYTEGGRGNLKNVRLRKLPFANQASGAASAYDVDLGAIIEHSLARGEALAAKAEFVRTAVANGVARWDKPGQQIEGAKEVPYTRPPRGTQEGAEPGKDTLYVDDKAYDEVRRALAVDRGFDSKALSTANWLITRAALSSTAEATYHAKNLLTFLMKPHVNPLNFLKHGYEVMTKDPGAADRLVELARIGAMKEQGFESAAGAMSKYNPLQWMGKFLDVVDRSMRLTAEDAFDSMRRKGLVDGSETNKRDFINQLGQYNRKAQNKWVALLRDTGLGPFATAGSNYYMQGMKTLALDPGVKATSFQAAVQLRAEMLGRLASVVGATALANYLMWKRPDGDDNTPLGAIKVSEDGNKTGYFDLTNLTGLTRGMRQTGLLALAEGLRKGGDEKKPINKGVQDLLLSTLHPAEGPPVQFAATAITGHNTGGYRVAPKAKKDELQAWENFKAAVKNANPAYSVLSGSDRPGKEVPLGERLWKLAGPFGVKYREPERHRR